MILRKTSLVWVLALCALAQQQKPKTGLFPEDWKYTLAPGVTSKEVVYYSDGIACYAKLFYPKGFSTEGKTPGVVLGQGWAGTHFSIEKYGARFAEKGLVAMVIDYRGWGESDGFPTVLGGVGRVGGDQHKDDKRYTEMKADVVIKRTRLLPMKQVEDYRNAISYLQGEPWREPRSHRRVGFQLRRRRFGGGGRAGRTGQSRRRASACGWVGDSALGAV